MDRWRDRRSRRDSALGAKSRRPRAPRGLRATRAGWCFIAIVFGVGFAALNTGNNLLYLVLALLLAFLVLSGILSETSLRGIRVERRLPRELYARTPQRVVLHVRNDLARVASFAVSLEDCMSTDAAPEVAGRAFALRIGPKAATDRSYAFEPPKRGELHFESVRVSTRFPFGLFVKSREFDLAQEALVYPEIQPVSLRQDESDGEDHHERVGRSRRGDDVTGIREFVPGDSVSRVHWRRSLHTGRLLVGEREGEASGEVEVLLPLSSDTPTAQVEELVRRAASEVVAHLEAGLRVGLRTPDIRFEADAGFAHRRTLLVFLARVTKDAPLASVDDAPSRARTMDEPSIRTREAVA